MTQKVAGLGLAPFRPYWKGHDQKEDEELAEDLFFGRQVIDTTGRPKTEYPSKGSMREKIAREALARFVTFCTREDDPLIMFLLCCALKHRGTERVIDFRTTVRGRPANDRVDMLIDHYVYGLAKRERGGVEAAVAAAQKKFGRRRPDGSVKELSREAVFKALARAKRRRSIAMAAFGSASSCEDGPGAQDGNHSTGPRRG
jgi:hypothetical protein